MSSGGKFGAAGDATSSGGKLGVAGEATGEEISEKAIP
jgi:hypothetical protein